MSQHDDLGPELRRLAQLILERLEPAVRAAAAMARDSVAGESVAGDSAREPGPCQQVWCPVCALAAWSNGEQHPLLNVIAEHGVTLMSVIQAMVANQSAEGARADPAGSGDARGDGAPPPSSSVGFHHIPIVVEDGGEGDLDSDADRDADV